MCLRRGEGWGFERAAGCSLRRVYVIKTVGNPSSAMSQC